MHAFAKAQSMATYFFKNWNKGKKPKWIWSSLILWPMFNCSSQRENKAGGTDEWANQRAVQPTTNDSRGRLEGEAISGWTVYIFGEEKKRRTKPKIYDGQYPPLQEKSRRRTRRKTKKRFLLTYCTSIQERSENSSWFCPFCPSLSSLGDWVECESRICWLNLRSEKEEADDWI